jgi:hypothetical protein
MILENEGAVGAVADQIPSEGQLNFSEAISHLLHAGELCGDQLEWHTPAFGIERQVLQYSLRIGSLLEVRNDAIPVGVDALEYEA